MKIEDILIGIPVIVVSGKKSRDISGIEFDSRKVKKDSLFVAVKGYKTDGHEFINSAKALGMSASNYFGNPTSSLKLVGVTGTNGKTTIATLLYRMFLRLGYKCGLFSTVCNYINEKEYEATHTTPDPIQLIYLLSMMLAEGCDFAFMEVSSHSADQKRIAGLKFAGGIFTNLTHDHLDYHKTFENYLAAKKSFFDSLPAEAFALVNLDDRNGRVIDR